MTDYPQNAAARKLDDELFSELSLQVPEPSAKLSAAIVDEVHNDIKPVRSFSKRQRLLACGALGLGVVSILAILRRGSGVHAVTESALLGTIGWALVLIAVLALGIGEHRSTAKPLRLAIAFGVPLAFLTYLGLLQTELLTPVQFHGHEHANAFRCGAISLGLGAVTMLGASWAWKRSDPFNPGLTGALIGLFGGLAGALSIGLVCPGREGWHLWLGHGLSVAALVVLGSLLGRRILAP